MRNQTHPNHFYYLIIFLLSLVFCLDLFLHPGEAATFDSPIHITNMAMYQKALLDGDFPVTWAGKFANYGLPTPLVSQQLTSYLGAILILVTQNALLAYKLIVFLGTLAGSLLIYHFLKIYSKPQSALVGSILYLFSAYRLINVYIRGALPEVFAMGLIPLLLIGLYHLYHNQKNGLPIFFLGSVLLILTHPFVFLLSFFILIPYGIFLYLENPKNRIKATLYSFGTVILALGISSWYLFPLILEIKYFVIARNTTQFVYNQFLNLLSYFREIWPYFYREDVFVRGNIIQFGLIETSVLILGLGYLWLRVIYNRDHKLKALAIFLSLTSVLIIFMTTSLSLWFYENLPLLSNIQFPWRMLTILTLIPPIVLALCLDRLPYQKWVGIIIICLILIIRLPQAYGKNYTLYPKEHYTQTTKNLHFDSLNTIWMGNALTYPLMKEKIAVVEGSGEITDYQVKNSTRKFTINASEPIRMADFTFYFPGWKAYVDNQEVPIEFQDVNYRGVITYKVPAGIHEVKVIFKPTKVRLAGYLTTLFFLFLIIFYLIYVKKPHKKSV